MTEVSNVGGVASSTTTTADCALLLVVVVVRAEREENGEERDFFVGEDYCAQLPCDSIVGVGDGLRGRGRVVVVRETSGGSDSSGLKPFEETTWSYLGLLCSISRLRMRVHASLAYLKAKKKWLIYRT